MLPPRCTREPFSRNICAIISVVVLLPRVPVTPIITTSGNSFITMSHTNAADIYTGTFLLRAWAIYSLSIGTPAALRIKSLFSKSSNLCSPNTYVMFVYSLSNSSDTASCSDVFLSVTITSAPFCAKNAVSPIPRPSKPSPMTVTFLFSKYGA